MNPVAVDCAVVIPTVGRESLAALVATAAAGDPAPSLIVVADDRPEPTPALDLPQVRVPVRVVHSGGRGPAAARNAGWLATDQEWVAFVDDDVRLAPDWCATLARDLAGLPPDVGASSARIVVPPPPGGRRPTDEERRTTALASAPWITADMAYRRTALLATGGFDERFPRAFREDSDLALRTVRAGFRIVSGDRVTEHPIRARGGWLGSLRAQAGNADNALLRAKFGPHWRREIGEPGGRTGRHLLTVCAAGLAAGALVARRPRPAVIGFAGWLGLTAELAVRRIVPGPRTPAEIAAMLITSAAIPPVALAHRAAGEWRVRRHGPLIHDVAYLADPDRVAPVDGAGDALGALRRRGLLLGVVSNQSGVARGLIEPEQLSAVNSRVDALLGPFDTWQTCPHGPDEGCECRKPRPGLVLAAARELGVDPSECLVIGDIGADVQAALRAGARAVLVPTPLTRPGEVAHARTFATVASSLSEAVDHALAVARSPESGRKLQLSGAKTCSLGPVSGDGAEAGPGRRVLLVRLDSMGDVLLTGGAVRAVARSGCRVTMLVAPRQVAVARMLPGVDEVIAFDAAWVPLEPAPLDSRAVQRTIRSLRRRRFDAALIFTSFHQSPLPAALLLRLAGVGWIGAICEDYPGSLLDLRHRVPDDLPEAERDLSLATAAGFDADDRGARPAVRSTSPPPRWLPRRPYVVVHPGAAVPARRPSATLSRAIVVALSAAGWGVVVTGAPAESALTHEVSTDAAVDAGGRLDLDGLAAVLAGAEAVVAPNTGPAHLAAAVGTPVVSLFAPVVPAARWAPYGVPVITLGDQQAACRDTRARVCPVPGHPCLSSITPEAVVAAVRALTGASAPPAAESTLIPAGGRS